MSIKFTTTEKENPNISLLFEFLDHEVPEEVEITLRTSLGKNEFNGGLQSNQINGIFLEPITISGKFHGTYVRKDETGQNIITADERSQELGRLQGRVVKFFFENMTSYVIIERFRRVYKDLCDIQFELVLAPHDFQEVVKPEGVLYYNERGADLLKTELKQGGVNGEIINDVLKAEKELLLNPEGNVKTNILGTEAGNASPTDLQNIFKKIERDKQIQSELDAINNSTNLPNSNLGNISNGITKNKLIEERNSIKQDLIKITGYADIGTANNNFRIYGKRKNTEVSNGITVVGGNQIPQITP